MLQDYARGAVKSWEMNNH